MVERVRWATVTGGATWVIAVVLAGHREHGNLITGQPSDR